MSIEELAEFLNNYLKDRNPSFFGQKVYFKTLDSIHLIKSVEIDDDGDIIIT